MYEDPAEAVSSRRATIDVSSQVHLEAVLSNNPFEGADRPHPLPPPPGLSGSPRLRNDKVGIVVTHPHPMLGGNMHNNVVVALFERFAREGFRVVRFNFRGTGRSTGSKTWRGSGEREDTLAVCRFLQSECGVEAVYLIGYSYGAVIGCSIVNDVDIIKGCIAVSYPFGVLTWILLGHLFNMARTNKPCLWVIGSEDNFTSVSKLKQSAKVLSLLGLAEEEDFEKKRKKEKNELTWWKTAYTPEYFRTRIQTLVTVQGKDHFWFDDEDILTDICLAWLEARLRDEQVSREELAEESQSKL